MPAVRAEAQARAEPLPYNTKSQPFLNHFLDRFLDRCLIGWAHPKETEAI